MFGYINSVKCIVCGHILKGRQRKYCSTKCKWQDSNTKYQAYGRQFRKGFDRKLSMVEERGGGCEECGYRKNLAALDFHHIDPTQKRFNLNTRDLANRSLEECREEFAKCRVLCRNCHAEGHYPQYTL